VLYCLTLTDDTVVIQGHNTSMIVQWVNV